MSNRLSLQLSKAEQTENKMEGVYEDIDDQGDNKSNDDSWWLYKLYFPVSERIFIESVEEQLNKGKCYSSLCEEIACIRCEPLGVPTLATRCTDFGFGLMDLQKELTEEYNANQNDPLKLIQIGRGLEFLDPILNDFAGVLEKIVN